MTVEPGQSASFTAPTTPGTYRFGCTFHASLALLVLLATGARVADALAFLVAASAFGVLLLYRYIDVGTLGPLPNMYGPFWYPLQTATATAAAEAAVAYSAAAVVAPVVLAKPCRLTDSDGHLPAEIAALGWAALEAIVGLLATRQGRPQAGE